MRYFNVAAKAYLKLFYRQHYHTHILAPIQNIIGSLSLSDGQYLINGGLYLAGLHLGSYIPDQTGKDLCLGLRGTGAESASHDADVAHIDVFQIDLGVLPRQRSDHDPASAVLQIMDTLAHDLTAQTIDGNVHGMSLLQLLLQYLHNILLHGIYHHVSVQMSDGLCLLVGENGGDYTDAEGFRHGDDDAGQSAGTCIHQQSIAGLVHLGVSRFHECFKKETGMTVIEYKKSVAVKHAALLLLDGDRKSIEEISSECGFHSAEYFRRVFRTHTGKSPKEYRKDWGYEDILF